MMSALVLSAFSLGQLENHKGLNYKNLSVVDANIKYFSLGFNNALADSFWIRLIQDIDYCKGYNVTEVKWDELKTEKPKCSDGWVSKMFDLITELSPDFYLVYRVGITAIPIIVGDVEGAEKFVNKATKKYPNDWTIAYRSAYFFIFEKKDPLRAAELLKVAGQNGAPEWVMSLSARLYDEAGQTLLGISVLEDTIKTTKEGSLRDEFQKRLDKLKAKYEKLKH